MNADELAALRSEAGRAAFLARVNPAVAPEDYRVIAALVEAMARLEKAPAQLRKLQHLLFGPKTERTEQVCPPAEPPPVPPAGRQRRKRRKGHGRTRAEDFTGADWKHIEHQHLRSGQRCPACRQGTLRQQRAPARLLRIEGSPPVTAQGFTLERLRCDTCGMVFTAPAPREAGEEKYAPSVAVTVAVLRYGTGVPHHRLARLQRDLGVPLPESTQWELLEPLAAAARPVLAELILLAANAAVIHQDDTTMRILDLRRPGSPAAAEIEPGRKGTFTTNLLAESGGHSVALFFTGWRHAGENLADVLRHRAADLAPPIQMCDALAANRDHNHPTVLAGCLAHARREHVTAAPSFPEECRYVLDALGEVYRFDAEAKEQGLSPEQRLVHHQTHSQPVMARLEAWLREQIDQKQTEPNSSLGQAIGYMLKHWKPLTLFLRHPGAPLDNNRSEQCLKMAILHRKNSLSYKTLGGARTGDLFMSLIHTCRLNRINPFAYLLAIAARSDEVKLQPAAWLPWNYPPAPALAPPLARSA